MFYNEKRKAYLKEWEEKTGSFIDFFPYKDAQLSASDNTDPELKGLPFAIKDNIALKGASLTCGSKMLESFKSPYTATAVEKLIAAGCVPIGKTNMDEFGMGSSYGISDGSAAAVAAGFVPFALGSDTGGSVRQPAAFCGVVGLKPTYGAVSRNGLTAYASSLEVIGIFSDTVSGCRKVFSVIRGKDPKDQTSKDAPKEAPALYGSVSKKKGIIGVISPSAEAEDEVRKGFEKAKSNLAVLGFTLKEAELPGLKYAAPAYYAIASAEASANLARFDGIRYGKRPNCAAPDELIGKARNAGFGGEVKLRILLGTYLLRSGFQEQYYQKAQRIRAAIRRNFEALLGDSEYKGGAGAYDAILLPVFPARTFGRSESSLSSFAQKAADIYTCCANLAGLPALSFPASVENGLPVGVQLIGRAFAEGTLLDIAEEYESEHPFPHFLSIPKDNEFIEGEINELHLQI